MATRTPTEYTGTITGQTGSLITVLDAALVTGEGWTKVYSGTNKAVYQPASGNAFVLRVLDDGSVTGGAREACCRAAESATDVDTLVDPFPLVSQSSDNNCVWRKSDTADSTTRPYWIHADDRSFHLTIEFGANSRDMYSFAQTEQIYGGDSYNTYITTRNNANVSTIARALNGAGGTGFHSVATNGGLLIFARSADGLVKSEYGGIIQFGSSGFGNISASVAYPNTSTNKLPMAGVLVASMYSAVSGVQGTGASIRGYAPFLFEPLIGGTITGMSDLDTFEHTAYDSNAEAFIIFRANGVSLAGATHRFVLQRLGTWDVGV